jgi:hypothetical protein
MDQRIVSILEWYLWTVLDPCQFETNNSRLCLVLLWMQTALFMLQTTVT